MALTSRARGAGARDVGPGVVNAVGRGAAAGARARRRVPLDITSSARVVSTCRETWARVTIGHFRHSAFQNGMGHRHTGPDDVREGVARRILVNVRGGRVVSVAGLDVALVVVGARVGVGLVDAALLELVREAGAAQRGRAPGLRESTLLYVRSRTTPHTTSV
jgi:hypothetical protein